MKLHTISPPAGSRTRKTRVGRGEGSGLGKTCGRGGKGQKGRAGATIRRGFEGGQMPILRRLPKLGFTSRKKLKGHNVYVEVNLSVLNGFENGTLVTCELLKDKGFCGGSAGLGIKILGSGDLKKKVSVKVNAISAAAKAKIEALGGTVEMIKLG